MLVAARALTLNLENSKPLGARLAKRSQRSKPPRKDGAKPKSSELPAKSSA